ncbi:hypothetical protein E5288_WYG011933 [Bos mutus]|uniref:Uncharacterized protein n=1 Tax=Bos mutus TaxID=72004 RepID=A0A6B0QX37_9CETA|nr:hypothetical protein [Bos mutus]
MEEKEGPLTVLKSSETYAEHPSSVNHMNLILKCLSSRIYSFLPRLNRAGVVKDQEMAMHWFRRASQQNHPHGSFNLAVGKLKNITGSMEVGKLYDNGDQGSSFNFFLATIGFQPKDRKSQMLASGFGDGKTLFSASKTTILDLTTIVAINAATTTAKRWVPEEVRSPEAWLLSNEAVIKMTLASAVLKILIVALIAYSCGRE